MSKEFILVEQEISVKFTVIHKVPKESLRDVEYADLITETQDFVKELLTNGLDEGAGDTISFEEVDVFMIIDGEEYSGSVKASEPEEEEDE